MIPSVRARRVTFLREAVTASALLQLLCKDRIAYALTGSPGRRSASPPVLPAADPASTFSRR
jgi:hypothetical protein